MQNALIFLALAAATYAAMYWLVDAGIFVSGIAAVCVLAVGISRAIADRGKRWRNEV